MEANTLKELIASETAVGVYFSAPNCSVCHALKPKVEDLFAEDFPNIKFVHIELDKSPGIAGEFSIFSAPTLLVFLEGKEFLRKVRLMSIPELREKIERTYALLF